MDCKLYRVKIEIDIEAENHQDAMERGLDLLMNAPSVSVDVTCHEGGEMQTIESSPEAAMEYYGGIVCMHGQDPNVCHACETVKQVSLEL